MRKLTLTLTLILASLALASTAAAATTVERDIPFEATITGCGDTITLSGTLIGIFTEQELGGGLLLTFHSSRRAYPARQVAVSPTTGRA